MTDHMNPPGTEEFKLGKPYISSAALYLKERDEALKERDEALKERDDGIRQHLSADAKLAALRIRHNYLHDEDCQSNEWGDDDCHCSGENGRLPSEAERVQTGSIRDELTHRAEAAEAERNEALDERDALQARIDRVLALAERWQSISLEMVGFGPAGELREALEPSQTNVRPADDSSEAEDDEEFCDDCAAGTESPEHHEKCVAPDESPPFKVGQWLRLDSPHGEPFEPFQVTAIRRDEDGEWVVPHPDGSGVFVPIDGFEPWTPQRGERVTGETRVGDSQKVTSTYRRRCDFA